MNGQNTLTGLTKVSLRIVLCTGFNIIHPGQNIIPKATPHMPHPRLTMRSASTTLCGQACMGNQPHELLVIA
ncbi:MAG: hypothetical protein IPI14_08900 [Polaromonas sp.]|nr:hypothetical protein [Polaromonas sp.]